MSSQQVVDYCHDILKTGRRRSKRHGEISNELVRKDMAQFLVLEALKRGSMDNISVVIIWLS